MNDGKLHDMGKPYEVLKKDDITDIYGIDIKAFMIEVLRKWV